MFTPAVKEVIGEYIAPQEGGIAPGDVPRIHVDEIASRVAAFYERIRNVVDYREEHLLRKHFMSRVLRRRLVLNPENGMAEAIIKDIIRAGHLPNDTIPETRIREVQVILDGYREFVEFTRELPRSAQEDITRWLLTITARALEEKLFPPRKDIMMADLMWKTMRPALAVRGGTLKPEERDLYLFIAIQQALLKVDRDQLEYRLIRFLYPHWNTMQSDERRALAGELPELRRRINALAKSRMARIFFTLTNRYDTVFQVTGDVIDDLGSVAALEEALKDESILESAVSAAYKRRFQKEKGRLRRLAFLSVLSFFISKIAVALAIEIPLERLLTGGFSMLNTGVNIAFPPFLMAVIVSAIHMPNGTNEMRVFEEVKNVLRDDRERTYLLVMPKKRSLFTEFIVRLSYLVVFVAVLYGLVRLLNFFHFNVANIVVFIFFVSMVAATGVRVHNRSRELSLMTREPGFLSFLLDLIALPFITLGKWILNVLSKFNPLTVFMNLLIEVPFQILVEFVENFRGFIKSKKEEIM